MRREQTKLQRELGEHADITNLSWLVNDECEFAKRTGQRRKKAGNGFRGSHSQPTCRAAADDRGGRAGSLLCLVLNPLA